jgi:hypothetical protein
MHVRPKTNSMTLTPYSIMKTSDRTGKRFQKGDRNRTPKLATSLLGAIALAVISTSSAHGQATFTNGTFSTDAVLTLAGPSTSELYGVAFDSSSNVTTGNGYTFLEDPAEGGTVPVSYGNGASSNFGNIFMGKAGATTGDTNFNTVLGTAQVPSNGSLILGGLTAGATYDVLFLDDDNRGGITGNRTFSVTDGASSSASQQFEFDAENAAGGTPGVPNVGGYILEQFTASGTTEDITLNQANGNQLNAILVTTATVPEPAVWSMLLVGGVLALAFRKSLSARVG